MDRITEEKKAITTVKGFAVGVFFVSILLLVFAINGVWEATGSPLLLDPAIFAIIMVTGGVIGTIGVIAFVLGWFLFKKQSYPVAILVTILTGLFFAACVVLLVIVDGKPQSVLRLMVSVFLFLASYQGTKAAAVLKKIRTEKFSLETFS